MNLDEELRHTLTHERYKLPGWPDATRRVQVGVARRRRARNLAVAGVAAAVAALVAVPLLVVNRHGGALPPATPATSGPQADVVPWADLPGSLPSPASPTPRSTAVPCTAADLPREATVQEAGPHHWVIIMKVIGDHRCTLSGWPVLSVSSTDGSGFDISSANNLPTPRENSRPPPTRARWSLCR